MSLLDTLTKTGAILEAAKEEQKQTSGKPWQKGKRFQYMNLNKKDILEKYPLVFQGINISEVKGAPILIPRATVMKKVEEIYNEQFHILLKSKTTRNINLAKTVYDVTRKNVKRSRNYFVQSLANLMYSADKYGSYPEVESFLTFVQAGPKDLAFLFYIYNRQNFKIHTYNSFYNHKKEAMNPLLIDISYTQALTIIEQAFYYDDLVISDLKRHMKTKVKPKQRIKYYDFLLALMEPKMSYRDLELMNYLIALYNIKKPEFLLDTATLTTDIFSDTRRGAGGGGEYDDSDPRFGGEGGIQVGRGNRRSGLESIQERPAWEADVGGDDDPLNQRGKGLIQRVTIGGIPDDMSIYLEDPRVIQKYKNKIKAEEVEVQKNIKGVLAELIRKYIAQYKEKNSPESLSRTREEQIYDLVFRKVFKLCAVVFYADRKKYFDLLRVSNNNKKAQKLWADLGKQYLYLKNLKTFSKQVAIDFIKTYLKNPLVKRNIDFFLGYEYGCPNPIIDDAENIDDMSDEE